MKLKSKIFATCIIMFIFPIILALISIILVSNYQSFQTQSKYGFDTDTIESIANPIKMLDWLTMGAYNDIFDYIIEDVDALEDEEVLQEINDSMNAKYSFLVMRKNDNVLYIGNKDKYNNINHDFPNFSKANVISSKDDDGDEEKTKMVYLSGDYPCLVKQLDFIYSDGSKGSAFIVINVNEVIPQIKMLAIEIIVIFVLIMLLTNIALVSWIYKSVLKPINKLSNATQRISGGDLEFSLVDDKEEGIASLFSDFEHMRCRLKELLEAQSAYEKESRELISNISHDLKTPLTAIKGYSEGILDGVADTNEKREKYVKTIYNKACDMTVLVDELSLYSKLDGNLMPYVFEKININDYFTDCIEEIAIDVELENICLKYESQCDKDTVVIMDVEQIKRVINNIISNAVKYIDDKPGEIKVRLLDKDRLIQIEIEDNGKGIEKKDQQFIFDRFYRTDSSRNSAKGGTGLGLSIAKKIIERHGGSISVEGDVGIGTTIVFTLPKDENEEDQKNVKKKKRRYHSKKWYSIKGKEDIIDNKNE